MPSCLRPAYPAVVLAAALAAGCAAVEPAPRDIWPAFPSTRLANAGGFLDVTGVGKPDLSLTSETQRKSGSRDAAILDARAILRDYLERIMLAGNVSLGEQALQDKAWRDRLEKASSAFEVVETKWEKDGTAAVVLRAERRNLLETLGLEDR